MTCGWQWTQQAPELETEEWQITTIPGVERATGQHEEMFSIPQSETSEAHWSNPGLNTGTSSKRSRWQIEMAASDKAVSEAQQTAVQDT